MQQIQIIGNLGEDCQVREFNSSKFVSFRVACTEKIRRGDQEENITTWYSCTYNRFESGIVPYLKKGAKVFVQGRPTYSLYDSAAYHCKMIDIKIFCDVIHLCGSKLEQGVSVNQTSDDNFEVF